MYIYKKNVTLLAKQRIFPAIFEALRTYCRAAPQAYMLFFLIKQVMQATGLTLCSLMSATALPSRPQKKTHIYILQRNITEH